MQSTNEYAYTRAEDKVKKRLRALRALRAEIDQDILSLEHALSVIGEDSS
jgi:hypothetical protein